MIVYKQWDEYAEDRLGMRQIVRVCDGWFLFGVVPIYVRRKFG